MYRGRGLARPDNGAGVQRAFAAVLANPWADEPRERFAEKVEATDPDRAKFVRAQLAVAEARRRAGVRKKAVESEALAASFAGLKNGVAWSGGVGPLLGFDGSNGAPFRYRRGFVEEATLSAPHFLKVASALFARAPILDLVLRDVKGHAAALFASPHLARIRSLDLSDNKLGDAEIAILARSPHLSRLRWLSLYFNSVSDTGVEALAASATLPALRFVRFDSNPCGDPNPYVDEEDGRTYGLIPSSVGEDLVAKHGPIAWIGDNPSELPPDPETFE